jgi:hypothetical protein
MNRHFLVPVMAGFEQEIVQPTLGLPYSMSLSLFIGISLENRQTNLLKTYFAYPLRLLFVMYYKVNQNKIDLLYIGINLHFRTILYRLYFFCEK